MSTGIGNRHHVFVVLLALAALRAGKGAGQRRVGIERDQFLGKQAAEIEAIVARQDQAFLDHVGEQAECLPGLVGIDGDLAFVVEESRAKSPEEQLGLELRQRGVLGGEAVGAGIRLGLLHLAQHINQLVDGRRRPGDADLFQHLAVGDEAGRSGHPRHAETTVADPGHGETGFMECGVEILGAEHLVDIGETARRRDGRQPALLQLRDIGALAGTFAQQQRGFHLGKWDADGFQVDRRIGGLEGGEGRLQKRLAAGFGVAPAGEHQLLAGLRPRRSAVNPDPAAAAAHRHRTPLLEIAGAIKSSRLCS